MQSLDIFTNNDCLNSSFLLQKKAHCGATRAFQNHFTQNLKFIYADTSAASAEFLMSGPHLAGLKKKYILPPVELNLCCINFPQTI